MKLCILFFKQIHLEYFHPKIAIWNLYSPIITLQMQSCEITLYISCNFYASKGFMELEEGIAHFSPDLEFILENLEYKSAYFLKTSEQCAF